MPHRRRSTGHDGDENGNLGRVPEGDQHTGGRLVPAQLVPDQRVKAAVQASWHILIGVVQPQNGDHDDPVR